MTQQEIIERDVRLLIGDLHLQLVMARARIQELEAGAYPVAEKKGEEGRPNGKHPPGEEAAAP